MGWSTWKKVVGEVAFEGSGAWKFVKIIPGPIPGASSIASTQGTDAVILTPSSWPLFRIILTICCVHVQGRMQRGVQGVPLSNY